MTIFKKKGVSLQAGIASIFKAMPIPRILLNEYPIQFRVFIGMTSIIINKYA